MRAFRRLLLLFLFLSSSFFGSAQLSTINARRIGATLYDVFDSSVNQAFTFTKVEKYLDGTAMRDSKCDNIIYIKYKNEYFKRNYDEKLDIRWFGCSQTQKNNQIIINQILKKYHNAYVPNGTFMINQTIVIPENATLFGNGRNSIVKLISKMPADGISIYRRGILKSLKLDCSQTDMDLSSAVLINPWNDTKSDGGEVRLQELQIVGNYPQLQGVGLKLKIASGHTGQRSLIAFCKFYDINIYGFRDGIFCDLNHFIKDNISYINANTFDNILIYNCLRPVRMINTASELDVKAGKSNISSNIFKSIIIQHAVGDYPAFYIDGGDTNEINSQIIDWQGLYLESSRKSYFNNFNFLPHNNLKIKVAATTNN